jgi:DNA (cytosine-5)-methyltransferase 1
MNELHLFAGAGGGILGGILLGHRPICAVEIDPYRRSVLLQRQRDGILPIFPIWDDIRTFVSIPWKGSVDIVCSGFPCQRHSDIGKIHGSDGFNGWPDTRRIISEIGPRFVFLENVPAILRGFWWEVIGDLSSMGFDSRWGVFSACSVGLPHTRERLFCLAHAGGVRRKTKEPGLAERSETRQSALPPSANSAAWISRLPEPSIPSCPDGLAEYMGELEAVGDGQVPAVVRLAWETLAH